MNVLVSIPKEKLEALRTLGIIDDNTEVYYNTKDMKESAGGTSFRTAPNFNVLYENHISKAGYVGYSDTKDNNNFSIESISKILRDASSDSEADEICIGDSWYIAYNASQDTVFATQGSKNIEAWIYLLKHYPFATEASTKRAIEQIGTDNLIAFFNTIDLNR